MKKVFAFAALYFALSIISCQDVKENSPPYDFSFYKNIGTQIPVETGMQWIDAYNERNNSQGKDMSILTPYTISDQQLQALTQSVSNLVGIAFHHATDDDGRHHFIAIPIDETLSVWSSPSQQRLYIDTNTDTQISKAVAQSWANNYIAAHPNDIWFHFFGSNIFDEIFTISYFNTLNVTPALNILNLTPQLLLVIMNEDLLGGRTTDDEKTIYDASSPCPPCGIEE